MCCRPQHFLSLLILTASLLNTLSVCAIENDFFRQQDLSFKEALFYAHQGAYFDAIVRLDADYLQLRRSNKESEIDFDVGELELRYRMHQGAGRAIQRVLDAKNIPQPIRNQAAYRLARIYYAKGYYHFVEHALDLIASDASRSLIQRSDLLRAQVRILQAKYKDAIQLLKPIYKSSFLEGYAAFNLAVAYLLDDQLEKGIKLLNEVSALPGNDMETLALHDKANITIGYRMLAAERPVEARSYFERVRLSGPFSNKALLWAGWTDVAQQNFDRALVPWTELQQRSAKDAAVQEALLALPYAYTQVNLFGQAALRYKEAITQFEQEIENLSASIKAISNGELRQALLRSADDQSTNYLHRLRMQEKAPATRYLLDLMAKHDFQESVKNIRDLEQLRLNTIQRLSSIQAFRDLLRLRRQYYQPRLPVIEKELETQNGLMHALMLHRDEFEQQLGNAQQSRDARFFITQAELGMEKQLIEIDQKLSRLSTQAGIRQARARVARLQGVLDWRINSEFALRLNAAQQQLKVLDKLLTLLNERYQNVLEVKRQAYQSYSANDASLDQFSRRLQVLRDNASALILRQATYLEKAVVQELEIRRARLVDYRVKARFALAESYDRFTRKQAAEAAERIRTQGRVDQTKRQGARIPETDRAE